ncbi:dockerin type I domain-containing protein, partial [Rhodopirellula sp.]
FFGNEWIKLRFYDGRNFSEEVDLQIEVKAVADAPSSIESSVADISQTILAGSVLGTFSVTDPDSKGRYEFVFSDPRFGIADGRLNGSEQQIVFVDGSVDFALEPEIEVTLSVLDAEADASVDSVLKFKVQDPNGPSLSIFPDSIRIDENTEDMLLTTLTVHDPYYSGAHQFSVDDERFSIVGDQLYLQPGVTVDHETEPVIALVVMASRENDTSVSVKETLLIDVTDVPEQPLVIDLSSYTVLEKVQGSAVGIVTIDGGFTKSRFQVSVDDSRFEVSDGVLKLLDNQIVERASQNEIELTLWVDDLEGVFHAISEKFVISVAENSSPHHNVDDPFDVDRSGVVTALDALAIINYLNVYGPGPIHRTDDDYAYDVNADQLVTSLDVLLVLNELNRQQSNGDAVGSGEQVEVNSDGLPAKDPELNSENGSPQELPVPSPTVTSDVSISGIGQSDLEQQADLSIGQVVDEQLSIEIEGDGVNSTLDDTLDLLSGDASIEGGS